jgi:methionyl-tRNA formyltransferase
VRIVFFGSPDFALPSLESLVAAGHDLALVVSQPARPVGRHAALTDPPVAARAKALGLPVWQPESLKGEEALSRLVSREADLFVVVAYGRILGPRTLAAARLGAVNVHGSILPRWRGASPVQAALLAGDAETGVSIMQMDVGMDTGAVIAEVRTPISSSDDSSVLSARLARMGAELLLEALPPIEAGTAVAVAQPVEGATECPKIRREDGRASWADGAAMLVRKERAFTPWPGLFAFRNGGRVKLVGLSRVDGTGAPGTVLEAGGHLVVACGEGAVAIGALQAEGRRLFPAREFVNGERVVAGEVWA